MLINTRRPFFFKKSYFGDKGHLNNEYSAHVMAQVIGENTKEICLAHLSQEANTKEMALDTYQRVFDEEHIYFDNIKEHIKKKLFLEDIMKIRILTIGKLKEKYLVNGINEYVKRLNAYCKVEMVEVQMNQFLIMQVKM